MSTRPFRSGRERRLRLASFDYSSGETCFVTLVTAARRHSLGRIAGGSMELSPVGQVVEECWLAIPVIHPGVSLGAFVVMPNHVHGLLRLPRPAARPPHLAPSGVAPGSLGAIVGALKAAATRLSSQAVGTLWQTRFHDRIVRSDDELDRIEEYIRRNVERWRWDPLNSDADTRRLDGPHRMRRQRR